MVIESALPLLPIGIVLVTSILIMVSGKRPNLREFWSIAGAVLTFFSVMAMVPAIWHGDRILYTLSTIAPGISLNFRVDALSLIFGILSSFLWIFTSFYSIGYMRSLNEHAQTRFYTCFAVSILAAQGISYSGGLFSVYLFYEILSFFTYPLVAHHQDEEGYAGGKKYLVYLMGTSKGFLLPALILTYIMTGTLDFADNIRTGVFHSTSDPLWITVTYVLFVAGFAKAAIMPLHNWLPSAMVAPTPVSALLHAVAVVKAGVFSMSRVMLSGFGVDALDKLFLGIPTAYVAAFTIVAASMIAMTKDDLKARLAYSTVSQLSYVIIGVAMLTPIAVQGGLLHIANHAFSKITLFFSAGAIFVAAHLKSIEKMSGLAKKMPWTFAAFSLATLSMIGVPPVCGFVSKWFLINGAVTIHQYVLLACLLTSTLLNATYFGAIIYKAYIGKPHPDVDMDPIHEAPWTMVAPLFFTAVMSVCLGLYPDFFLNLIHAFM